MWYGKPGHFCAAMDCQFIMCTKVGPWLVSTVGEYVPSEGVREIMASSRGITLEGIGDARLASWMDQVGFEDIGCDRKYETMVFPAGGPCANPKCGCGVPKIDGHELDMDSYNTAGDAHRGHYQMCEKYSHVGSKSQLKRLESQGAFE